MDPDKFDPGVPLLAIKITQFVPCCLGFCGLGFRVVVEIPLLFFLSISLVMMKVWKFLRSCSSFGLYLKNKGGGINQSTLLNNRPYQVVFLRLLLARFMGKSSNLTNLNNI